LVRRYLNGAKDIPPQKGEDLILTIDKATQQRAEELLRGRRGAVVAMNPKTGGIIAFVSSPEYDLANFASVTPAEVLDSLNNDPDKPLFNRASMSIHSPGSTFKMLVALALLQEGIISTGNTVTCKGGLQFGNRFFECTHVHGKVNVESAIEKSCNTFFYTYVQKLGLSRLAKYARMFGFGRKTGIDIYEEAKGLVPDKKYYDRVYGKYNWTKGVLLNLAIGQGEIGVTPLQLAQYTALIANWGRTVRPHFVYALRKLEKLGFVSHERYGGVVLTSEGLERAQSIYERHTTLLRFFRDILGVSDEEAERDACIMEHYLGKETVDRLTKFVMFVDALWQRGIEPRWLERFRKFMEGHELPPCERLKER